MIDYHRNLTEIENELLLRYKMKKTRSAILSLNELDTWFDTSLQDFTTVHTLLKPYDNKEMEAYVVNDYVNRPGFDAPACIEPAI